MIYIFKKIKQANSFPWNFHWLLSCIELANRLVHNVVLVEQMLTSVQVLFDHLLLFYPYNMHYMNMCSNNIIKTVFMEN